MNSDYCIYGKRPVEEALRASKSIEKILIQNDIKNDDLKKIAAEARQRSISVQYVPKQKIDLLARKYASVPQPNHQGVLAFTSLANNLSLSSLPEYFSNKPYPLIVSLEGVTDVGNMGAIARSAYCFGADLLLLPSSGTAAINPEAIRKSAGALEHLPVCRTESIPFAIKFLKANGFKIFAATAKAKKSLKECDFAVPAIIVFGDEHKGISASVIKCCDEVFFIPMFNKFDSLNVSASAAVTLYEVMCQRKKINSNEK
ncbi:MAG: 23S rRNA (guanosine(2251)-2'-O)-methyltransferase RlmB [Chitinophagales bacterium]|nr:23S rRNA (guanosine(2251)-2'-O)-methyltransferase RlmB [Chitinophagales bacterium]MDW8272892.1 23S rRNA (guanosine(2251)-2'-O)-methyltransferase RlmB [Chitinophagales bacterium]